MTVDHVIPESLVSHPDELMKLRQEYEIDENFPGFQVNNFENWVPSHPRNCNARKGTQIFPKKMTLLILQEVQQRLPKVRKENERLVKNRGKGRVLGVLSTAIENNHLTVHEAREFIAKVEKQQHSSDPPVLTFGLMTEEVLDDPSLPPKAPRSYPNLCDWLESDLIKRLRKAITTEFHYTEPSARSGETLSVRLVFPGLDGAQLEKVDLEWWEILEVTNFWEIYGENYEQAFRNA